MKFGSPHNVVAVFDGPDPDNFAGILAASCAHFGMNVVAVIMTGRPVNTVRGALPYEFNPAASRAVNRDNALHAKGILMRHGREHIPVFEGGRAPYTTIAHDRHIHERVTDIHDDAHGIYVLAGTIDDAVAYLDKIPGTLHFVCGGPLTDVAYLMQQPMLHGKFGILTAQLGMFGTGGVQVMGGGRRQFNATADAKAAHDVLRYYPGPLYMLPTDITKLPEHGFDTPEEIAALATSSAFKELAEMYAAAWPHMWGPRNMQAHLHDFHPAEMMSLLLARDVPHHEQFIARDHVGRYAVASTGIAHVPHLPDERERWGEIDLAPFESGMPLRFWADGVDTGPHRHILAESLNSPAFTPPELVRNY